MTGGGEVAGNKYTTSCFLVYNIFYHHLYVFAHMIVLFMRIQIVTEPFNVITIIYQFDCFTKKYSRKSIP